MLHVLTLLPTCQSMFIALHCLLKQRFSKCGLFRPSSTSSLTYFFMFLRNAFSLAPPQPKPETQCGIQQSVLTSLSDDSTSY